MYDCLIIGGGIGGMTAAIYAARAGLKCAVIEREQCGGQAVMTDMIENYPGFVGSGYELSEIVEQQAVASGAEVIYDEIESVELTGDIKHVTGSEVYESRAVIVAAGASHRRAGFKGEEELSGCGVSYCATCDGAFFEGREVAVIGGANTAVGEALYLSNICSKVYIVYRGKALRADYTLVERAKAKDNIEVIYECLPLEAKGDSSVDALITDKGELKVSGIFVAVGLKPSTDIYKDSLELDDSGYIKVSHGLKTGVKGVYAVGDCRVKQLRQLVTAAADGAIAANEVIKFLEEA